MWIANGANWFFGNPPLGWNPYLQLIKGNLVTTDLLVPKVVMTTANLNTVARIIAAPAQEPEYELAVA